MTALRTPRRGVLGLCLIARAPQRMAVEDPEVRAFFRFKLRSHQRTLAMMRMAKALRGMLHSDSSVAAYDLAHAIKAQSEARMLDDAAALEAKAAYKALLRERAEQVAPLTGDAARLMGTGLMAARALA